VQALSTGAGAELFEVGSHITDSNGEADVWVITGDSATETHTPITTYVHSGQQDRTRLSHLTLGMQATLTSGFTIGSHTLCSSNQRLLISMEPTWTVRLVGCMD
jgi:hypothetical protein